MRVMMSLRVWLIVLVLCVFTVPVLPQENPAKPLQLPVGVPPGPTTWLFGQPYGNTTGAFNNALSWYSAGQGLHFGIDLSMPCGTELVAVADGEVAFVDDMGFGSAPHNLILRHPALGLTSLYGHLLERPTLLPGQAVQKGQVVALSGDPDVTCVSRPHLHLEIRSADYFTAFNPVAYIDAPWHMLTTIGSFGSTLFQQDLFNAQRWMRVDDQPDVAFGGAILNSYSSTWPPPRGAGAPPNPPLPREPAPLLESAAFEMRKLGFDGCCFNSWWHPTDPTRLYAVDGMPGAQANLFEWSINTNTPTILGPAQRPQLSPDGTHEIRLQDGQVFIRRLSDGAEWNVQTQGEVPSISADNSRLYWEVQSNTGVNEFWVSDLLGQNARKVLEQPGGSARWLDDARLLINTSLPENRETMLSVIDTRDDSVFTLGSWPWLRGLDIAPGGGRLMFYLARGADPEIAGTYTIETQFGAQAQHLDWFGGWRWRDAESVYYIPFEPTTDRQSLMYYHLTSDESRLLIDGTAQTFVVTGGDWSVSADGRHIIYLSAPDNTMWLIDQIP
jgi:hypothetical protein